MGFDIHPMTAGDKPQLMQLLAATPEFEPAEIPVAEEVIDAYLARPGVDYQVLVAEESLCILGYICFGQTPLTRSTWDIYWMAVAMERRGRGIGAALLRRAEDSIRRAGGTLVLIETSSKPNYLPTRRFYLKNGYKKSSRIVDFYAPGDHRITFEKRF